MRQLQSICYRKIREPIKKKNDRIMTLPLLYIGMLKKHGFILSHNVELSRKKLQKDELCVNFYSLHKSFALYSVHFTIKV